MNDYGPRGYGDYGSGDYGRSDGGYGRRGDDFFSRDQGQSHDYGSYGDGRGSGFSAPYDEPSRPSSSGTASVRPPSPHDEPLTTGRARVPGADSSGPGRARGSARVGGKRSPSGELSEEEEKARKKAKKKKRRRRRLIALGCVMVMMIGVGTVAASVLFANVPVPEEIFDDLNESTSILYEDGKTEIGTVGMQDRKVLSEEKMPELAKQALVAAEDRKFWEHGGVDAWGVMRAFVNNVTGGDRQGGSSLEQQYVGHLEDMRNEDTYFRKAKEAVMAMKLGDEKSKDEIITAYLNVMPFGRGAFGIGAAAEAFFGKKVEDLDAGQLALLIAQLKASGGTYDPKVNPYELAEEKHMAVVEKRWNYVLDGMVDVNALDKADRDEFTEVPETEDLGSTGANKGAAEPSGFVTHRYALEEARQRLGLESVEELKIGGYKITTTLNQKLQKAAVAEANHKGDGAMGKAIADNNENLRSGLVSVDPKTGAILAYYGGNDGTGVDKAGLDSMHPPGSSFKEFTMVAALDDNISMESRWDGSKEKTFPDRQRPVRNAGEVHEPNISMKQAIRDSLNTPIYAMTDKVGANNVMLTARDMGITHIKDPETGDIIDLHDEDIDKRLNNDNNPRDVVDNEIGFGQYPVSVKDMAVANATLANRGVYHEPHFVKKIENSEGEVMWEANDDTIKRRDAVDEAVADDATHIISAVGPTSFGGNNPNGVKLPNGQGTAAKTGTWERDCDDECNQNSAIWYTGYTPSVATAVWVGDKSKENGVVELNNGQPAFGATITGDIWWKFMDKADAVIRGDQGPIDLPQPQMVGDTEVGNAKTGGDDEDDEDAGEEEPCEGPECEEEETPTCEPGDVQCCIENPGASGCDGTADPSDPGLPTCDPEEQGCPQGRDGEPAANDMPRNEYGITGGHQVDQVAIREERVPLTA